MIVGFKTDTGKGRYNNEDALLILPKYGAFMVADGVGGQNYGEMASRKAVIGTQEYIEQNPIKDFSEVNKEEKSKFLMKYFIDCFEKLNEDIMKLSVGKAGSEGMATTAVTAYIDGLELYVANIGDSRAYVMRDGVMNQISEDHTYVNNLVKAGTLTESEARVHPQKHIITKALGAEAVISPDFYRTELMKGDVILLCSDGLTGELTDEQIAELIIPSMDMNEVCRNLIKVANECGGNDNITVICIEI
jgi:protein phosphatase